MSDDTSRRQVLLATGATGLTLLAGCGGGGGDDGTTTTTSEMMGDTTTTDSMMGETTTTDSTMGDTTTDSMMGTTTFTVEVENVSTGSTLSTMGGSTAVPLSPVAYAAHTDQISLFTPGAAAGDALERLAEDGMAAPLAQSLGGAEAVLDGGAVATPDGTSNAGPLTPGDTYTAEFSASTDAAPRLSLATMFVQSNDLFYAPDPAGIPLVEDGEPREGTLTGELALWDAGTEVNQPPGEGGDQAPRQSGTDTGTPEGVVRTVADGYTYPDVSEVLSVTVRPGAMGG
ncbi:MAG: spondin domain-containing protein [Halobacteriaceae archaeon]